VSCRLKLYSWIRASDSVIAKYKIPPQYAVGDGTKLWRVYLIARDGTQLTMLREGGSSLDSKESVM